MNFRSFVRISALIFLSVTASVGQQSEFRIHVVGSHDEDVGNASVRLVSVQESRMATTDAAGTAIFTNLPEGKYDIRITAYGYVTRQLQNDEVTVTQSLPLEVTLSLATMICGYFPGIEYDNTRPRGAPVRGTVINADSRKGIRGATLAFRRTDANAEKITTRSQNKGEFEVEEIAPGRYRLHVTNQSFREIDVDLVVPAQDATVITVPLDRNDHIHVCQ